MSRPASASFLSLGFRPASRKRRSVTLGRSVKN